jgi:hypothetical protein
VPKLTSGTVVAMASLLPSALALVSHLQARAVPAAADTAARITGVEQVTDAAKAAGVPITFIVRPEGAHIWGLFDSEMRESWNLVIGPALGV